MILIIRPAPKLPKKKADFSHEKIIMFRARISRAFFFSCSNVVLLMPTSPVMAEIATAQNVSQACSDQRQPCHEYTVPGFPEILPQKKWLLFYPSSFRFWR